MRLRFEVDTVGIVDGNVSVFSRQVVSGLRFPNGKGSSGTHEKTAKELYANAFVCGFPGCNEPLFLKQPDQAKRR